MRKTMFRVWVKDRGVASGGIWKLVFLVGFAQLLSGCAAQRQVGIPDYYAQSPEIAPEASPPKARPRKAVVSPRRSGPDLRYVTRVVSEKEISEMYRKDPDLRPIVCMEILGRLNTRARYYIPDDIKQKRPMKVPLDFSAYKNWTPLPREIEEVSELSRFILVVKKIPFIGWYEYGKLKADTQISIGKQEGWTKAGFYRVLDKDADHISASYPNAFGMPAPMPWALRIYDRVWIHGGDVVGGYASHGCINLPILPAENLFRWAPKGTAVLVLEDLDDLDDALEKYAARIDAAVEKH